MAEKKTWKQIKKEYPNEWVLMVDCDEDELGYVVKGRVIYHHPKNGVFSKRVPEFSAKKEVGDHACLYTGQHRPPRDMRALLMEIRSHEKAAVS